MADPKDRWLFLLTIAPLPLACTEDLPGETTGGSTGTTAAPVTTVGSDDSEGVTSIATTTGVDGTSSEGGETTLASTGSTGMESSSSSEGTTMSIDPSTSTSTSESSSTTGEPLGLCELWGETLGACYGYNPDYYTSWCYDYVMNYVDPLCAPQVAARFQCQAAGCFADCSMEYEAVEECQQQVQLMECAMIPDVPGAGTIEMQCTDLANQAFACDAGGYYIPGFSYWVDYPMNPLDYAVNFCTYGAYFTFFSPPPGMGDVCGGAYEELLACLSALACDELQNGMFDDTTCEAEKDAVTCRCDLEA